MDLTPPPFTTSPASPEHMFTASGSTSSPCSTDISCPPNESSGRYPSPTPLVFQYKTISPYGAVGSSCVPEALLADTCLPSLESMAHAWHSNPDAIGVAASPPASVSSNVGNIVSVEYDPFATYEQCQPPYGSGEDYSTSRSDILALPRTPPPSTGASARTPTPVAATVPFGYTRELEAVSVKDEIAGTYDTVMKHISYSVSSLAHPPYPSGRFSATQPYEADSASQSWTKSELETSLLYSAPLTNGPPICKRPTGISKPKRASRKHTTREEANFQCDISGCGKFFSRSYNFKSHMETHDDKREYPFPCLISDCSKKFVRKTDLQRHNQSVHMKERNHRCDYCARLFARRDTLRRHMEDGCSKRFDIGTLDLRAGTYGDMTAAERPGHSPASLVTSTPGSLPPIASAPTMGVGRLTGDDPFHAKIGYALGR